MVRLVYGFTALWTAHGSTRLSATVKYALALDPMRHHGQIVSEHSIATYDPCWGLRGDVFFSVQMWFFPYKCAPTLHQSVSERVASDTCIGRSPVSRVAYRAYQIVSNCISFVPGDTLPIQSRYAILDTRNSNIL